MNVLIINAIVYTSETEEIMRAESIKDSMIYDLCLAFHKMGHQVTLYAAEPYQPVKHEAYPFPVVWGKCHMTKLFKPHRLPFMPELNRFLKENRGKYDLIISSEVFSLASLMASFAANDRLLVWHELAKHNAMLKKIPSKIWYNIVARLFMRKTLVVGRSEEAKRFVSCYCKKTIDEVIDHGVNLGKFVASDKKDDYFVVCSQLIARKRINGILEKYGEYLSKTGNGTKLFIIGDGNKRKELEKQCAELNIERQVKFMGKMRHVELLQFLAHAKALLINTEKDNSMISIVESIAVGTPVVTTEVPLNASYIKAYELGIAAEWTYKDLVEVYDHNGKYVERCLNYRSLLSTKAKVERFITIKEQYLK